MANPSDQTDYIAGFILNIQTVISNYQSYIGYKILETNEDAFIPVYPAISIEYANSTEEWKSMPKRKTIIATFDITYYFGSIKPEIAPMSLGSNLNWWWFNVRPSNTEPRIAITIESPVAELTESKKNEILKIINGRVAGE